MFLVSSTQLLLVVSVLAAVEGFPEPFTHQNIGCFPTNDAVPFLGRCNGGLYRNGDQILNLMKKLPLCLMMHRETVDEIVYDDGEIDAAMGHAMRSIVQIGHPSKRSILRRTGELVTCFVNFLALYLVTNSVGNCGSLD